eukprot:4122988-Karenia_brevis.AAC.1
MQLCSHGATSLNSYVPRQPCIDVAKLLCCCLAYNYLAKLLDVSMYDKKQTQPYSYATIDLLSY